MQKIPPAKGRPTGRTPASRAPTEERRPPRPRSPREPSGARKRSPALIVGIIAAILLVGAGAAFLAVTLSRSAGAPTQDVADSLKRAAYYADKGEFDEALNVLNGLKFDDPRVKAAMDDVLARKKAADDAAKQGELAALKAQQDQLKASLAQLGSTLKNQQQIVVQQPTTPPAENASAKEKELQKKVQDLMQKGAAAFNAGHYNEARKAFDQAVALAPDNSDALAYDGLSYLRENPSDSASVQKALELSKKSIEKNPDNWLPHRTLGEIYNSRKLSDDAMR